MKISEYLYAIKEDKPSPEVSFYKQCTSLGSSSNSQNYQDKFALWATHNPNASNFFVEFGATDGIAGSNTFILENDYGWTGILAEPIPEYFKDCVENRKSSKCFPLVVSDKSKEFVDFIITDELDLSTVKSHQLDPDEHMHKRQKVKEIIKVESITLFDVLEKGEAPEYINYISVDTEGSEYEILEKWFQENNKYTVGCFTVEHNWNNKKMGDLARLMNNNGYHIVFSDISRWDFFFIHNTHYKRLFT